MHAFAGRVKVVSHSSCRTSAIFKYFCPLNMAEQVDPWKYLKFNIIIYRQKHTRIRYIQICNSNRIWGKRTRNIRLYRCYLERWSYKKVSEIHVFKKLSIKLNIFFKSSHQLKHLFGCSKTSH